VPGIGSADAALEPIVEPGQFVDGIGARGHDGLREAMQSAGVVGQPDIHFLNDEEPTAR
jgi:hypothetical protein